MKHFAALLLIALFTLAILLFLTNPELLEGVWLWIVGFIGYIIALMEKSFQSVASYFRGDSKEKSIAATKASSEKKSTGILTPEKAAVDPLQQKIAHIEHQFNSETTNLKFLSDSTLTVLRYIDDGQTTLGLLFLRKKFFAYTLEDTHREEKMAGETRIPAGNYKIDFNKNLTDLTKKYRETRP